ncbi:MAG: thiamine pyrophosphate-binding protein [Candidatus Gastranaerophilales bacterium]|nr:thiamine pyrophosphate-binding protein [Candidatus Gastranaerophilales bacterium]
MGMIKVADYLVQELNKLGINDFFGLPGDYNFNILYAINDNPNVNWVGCTNELNAGYAADGYARVNGYGALVTTYGVGELSAINATAGSFAENIPVIHIVGVPATKFIESNALIHHNFLNPDYYVFERIYSNAVETTAYLNEKNAKTEIDRILSVFINKKRPVYVAIPVDICKFEIENNPQIEITGSNEENLNLAVEEALKLINKAQYPMILGDVLVKRFRARKEFNKLMENSGFPASNLLMGKGIIEADNKKYLGTFLSEYENINAYDALHESDCVISVGVINSDLNTYRTGLPFKPADYIEIQGDYTIVQHKKYENVLMKDVLDRISDKIETRDVELPEKKPSFEQVTSDDAKDIQLSAKYIFPRLQEFLQPDDIIFVETGIIPHGFAPTRLRRNTEVNTQTLWGSIGWATPAAFGGQMAEKDRRTILLTGEGSHQLTASEISNMMHNNLKPIIIVLNNSGYTIERVLCDDPWDSFNDIIKWDYSKLPQVFEGDVWTAQARTNLEFDNVLKQAQIEQKSRMCYIEIFTEKFDLPYLTQKIMEKIKTGNRVKSER